MQLGTVIGSATSTIKHASMQGTKLLVVQPRQADGRTADGDPVLAVDAVGAGKGETVMITSDGRFARAHLKTEATPVRWTVIGIQD
jgi:ethanolamine utilization protein EutN